MGDVKEEAEEKSEEKADAGFSVDTFFTKEVQEEWQILYNNTRLIFSNEERAKDALSKLRLPWPGKAGGSLTITILHVFRELEAEVTTKSLFVWTKEQESGGIKASDIPPIPGMNREGDL